MQKKLITILIIILSVMLTIFLGIGLSISGKLSAATKDEFFWSTKEAADYHLLVVVDGSYQGYDEGFEAGIASASEMYRVAVEVIEVKDSNYIVEALNILDMALYSKVDGVIIEAYANDALVEKISELSSKGIPIITLNEDLPKSGRISYVGVNRYNIGQAAGEALNQAMEGAGKVAVIDQKSYVDQSAQVEDLLILGLTDALKAYPGLTLERIEYTEQGVLSAETLASKILNEYPEINGFFCVDGQNTLGVAQILIDNNKVNDMTLIGYGDEDEILDYIVKGKIIEASIITNHEDVGMEAIKAFYDYKHTHFVSSYINTTIRVIDTDNIQYYISEKGGRDEE